MRRLRFILSMLGFAIAAIPASATITYTSCSSGCSDTSGSYATLPTEAGATGLDFTSTMTFVSAGLNGTTGIFTDPTTGTVFTNYSTGGTAGSGQILGSSFVQLGYYGTGTGIEVDLPANTYAIGMVIGDCTNATCSNSYNGATVGLGTATSHGSSYSATVNSGSTVFFSIVSDTPITSLFLTSGWNSNDLSILSFDLGQESGGSPAPEAGTFFTMGGGLLGLYFCRRPRLQKLLHWRARHNEADAATA